MKIALKNSLLFCLMVSSFNNVYAADILVVGTEYPGIFSIEKNGEFSGLGVEIIRAMAKQSGDKATFRIYPWARAMWMVENNLAHVLVGPFKQLSVRKRFHVRNKRFIDRN